MPADPLTTGEIQRVHGDAITRIRRTREPLADGRLRPQRAAGVESAAEMLMIAAALVGGLLVANAALPPRRIL